MKIVDYPAATNRLINALKYAGVTEIALDETMKLSSILEGNDVAYHELMFDENFQKMRRDLNYPIIEEDHTLGEIIITIHNAMYKSTE